MLSGILAPDAGTIVYSGPDGKAIDLFASPLSVRRRLLRTEFGVTSQDPKNGLRGKVSAGANISERLFAAGLRNYGEARCEALNWLRKVEIDPVRLDDRPESFSGGMQERLQIARNLVSHPRVVFMDEPTGSLDVSVRARILDLIRNLILTFDLAVLIVTHDIDTAKLLSQRVLVMKGGKIVESGLTDRVFDDPHHPYTQLLVSSIPKDL
jgi:putative phosphonate transport system ATP-binding protein